ncbi:hypothetical protein [Bacillus sp. CDB3]|uniref:hypothetical protein n=1 Tax=Bacillus sp. CDB3 TaxID=360310 RepID=UPI0009D88D8E|nr:hypothetical protein [Bacillus sp. CDB3]OQR53281.1 hypothetical protein CDB3_31025 [Bacillus sp. CDB3]
MGLSEITQGAKPLMTVPHSLGMVFVFLFIICVGMIGMLIIKKEWKQLICLLVLGGTVVLGVFGLYVTKMIADEWFLLHCAWTTILFLFLGSMVEWNRQVKKKEAR